MAAPVVAGLIQPAGQEFLVKAMLVADLLVQIMVAVAAVRVLLVAILYRIHQPVWAVLALQTASPVPQSLMLEVVVAAVN
jgi:hypothetical protein